MSANELRIGPIKSANQGHFLEAEFHIDSKSHPVYFQSDDVILTGNVEAFLACAIPICMRKGGVLVADGKVSQRFISGIPTILDIFGKWDSSLNRVEIRNLVPVIKDRPKGNRIGAFFSGGVDSFYTLLKHQNEITDLIFVHGFDIRLDDTSLRRRTSEVIRKVASSFGKNIIEIETNLRPLIDPYAAWGRLAHGAGLAAIGHLLSPLFSRIYIPATHTYAELFPWGSHPLLDPLWNSEILEFLHDGCEAGRLEKVALLSRYDIALQSLRVCWENPNGAYNCGECEKCIRTMLNLYVVGALDRCTTFDMPLDIGRILEIKVLDDNMRAFVMENLKALESSKGDVKLQNALRKIVKGPRWWVRTKERVKSTTMSHPLIYQVLKSANSGLKRLRPARPPSPKRRGDH